jgi:hypothetical protein
MAKTPVSFKLDDVERKLLDSIAAEVGGSRSDALRYALSAARKELGLYGRDAEAFIARLRASMDDESTIAVQLDDTWTPFVTVDGVRRDDIYVPTVGVRFDAEDFLRVFLGDRDNDVRIFVGVLPLRSGVPLKFSARDLKADMRPRPVAYFVT